MSGYAYAYAYAKVNQLLEGLFIFCLGIITDPAATVSYFPLRLIIACRNGLLYKSFYRRDGAGKANKT